MTRRPARREIWPLVAVSIGVPVAFFAILELALALAGVQPLLWAEDPYVGFASRVPLYVEQQGDAGPVRVTARNKLRHFNAQRFPARKPAGSYRIVCVGGSTTYGRPYYDTTSFCGWLRALLPVADPSRRWEVVNAGGISYASYRVSLLMEELVHYAPDLFVVYSGHNEFLERRTYASVIETPPAVRGLVAALSGTRTYTALRGLLRTLRQGPRPPPASELSTEVQTLLDDAVGPDAYTRDDALHEQVIAHYRFNLARMVDIAAVVGAETVLVTPASNLGDFSPFKSEPDASVPPASLARAATLEAEARAALDADQPASALRALDAALALDPRHAERHYLRGRALRALGRADEARAAFERARDEDICPLRAPAAVHTAVVEVGAERRAPVVDFAALVDRRAADGIPGDDLFLDHVHPTLEANRLLALALLELLVARGVVTPSAAWGPEAIARVAEEVEGRLDARAHGVALRNVSKVLGWAGKLEEADRLARLALTLAPDDPHVHVQIANGLIRRGEYEAAEARLARALELDGDHMEANLVLANLLLRRDAREEAAALYRSVLSRSPRAYRAHNGLGVIAARERASDEAIAHFEATLRIKPDNAEAHEQLGRILLERGEREAARDHLERAVAADPTADSARALLRRLQRTPG